MFDAILLMAGASLRSGLNYNKVLYKINNQPIYQYSLQRFLDIKDCEKVILVVRAEDYQQLSILENERIKITIGGNHRQESVANGVKLASSDIILIHDAARCNIKSQDIINVYENTIKYQACVLGNQLTDTIKEVDNHYITNTLNRNQLWTVQTPQGVDRLLFIKCLERANGFQGFDDVQLIEKFSDVKVRIIEGSKTNVKITNPSDFRIMEFLMKEGL